MDKRDIWVNLQIEAQMPAKGAAAAAKLSFIIILLFVVNILIDIFVLIEIIILILTIYIIDRISSIILYFSTICINNVLDFNKKIILILVKEICLFLIDRNISINHKMSINK